MKFNENVEPAPDFSPEQERELIELVVPLLVGQRLDPAGMTAAFAAFNQVKGQVL